MDYKTQQYKVLAVDDSQLNLEVIKELLLMSGYQAITSSTSKEAKELAVKECPDLIILDIMLPHEDGYKILNYLKHHPVTSAIPVIFITALTDIKAKVKGFELGATDYITKPFHPSEFLARIRNQIKLKQAQSELLKIQTEKLKQLQAAQTEILPKPADLPDAKFAVYYSSLHEAGGDYYDVLQTAQGTYGYFIGDIAGHDIQASFITAALQPLLRQNCSAIYSIDESMAIINQILIDILPNEKFLTASYLTINRVSAQAEYINMGHLPLIYCPVDQEVKKIEQASDALGAYPDPVFTKKTINLSPGDRFYMFTDGLLEKPEDKQLWPEKLPFLIEELTKHRNISLANSIEELSKSFISTHTPQKDDIIILGIEV